MASHAGVGWTRPAGAAQAARPAPHAWILVFVVVVLALNWISVLVAKPGTQRRMTVPFSPYFMNEVNAGQVKSISYRRQGPGRVRPQGSVPGQ
jgi:hypothetical protein